MAYLIEEFPKINNKYKTDKEDEKIFFRYDGVIGSDLEFDFKKLKIIETKLEIFKLLIILIILKNLNYYLVKVKKLNFIQNC